MLHGRRATTSSPTTRLTDNPGPASPSARSCSRPTTTVVERNTIEGAGGGGISVIDSAATDILENLVARRERRRRRRSSSPASTLVRGNDLRGNKGGIASTSRRDNTASSINNASGTLGTGIEIGELSPNNDVLHNTASENGGEGIEVDDSAPAGQGTLLEGNNADGNGGDGIAHRGRRPHRRGQQRASCNGGWGIYAAVGAIDRGGNIAAGNIEPAQCFSVVCTIGSGPGAPETWIVDEPAAPLSNSRNASFTYMRQRRRETPLHELVFECRIDSNDRSPGRTASTRPSS